MHHASISPSVSAAYGNQVADPVRHLYAHIPFCPARCDYCAFVTHIGSGKIIAPYVAALVREARVKSRCVRHAEMETVYLGGGTPSLLSPEQVGGLLGVFRDVFGLATGAEVTIEAHPATVDEAKPSSYLECGVNRISFGIESVHRDELSALGRSHDGGDPSAILHTARAAGFRNIAVDLMYGIPLQTVPSWQETLDRVLDRDPKHLSLYPLSIEPTTVFDRRRRRNQLELPSDEHVVDLYRIACESLARVGYEHYEVGSWARPGHASSHNLAYWHNRRYLGLGVGAHSYLDSVRTVNVARTQRYIDLIERGADPTELREELSGDLQREEAVMLGLRLLREGLDITALRREHAWDMGVEKASDLAALAGAGLIRVDGSRVFLCESAVPVANEIWERLAV